MAELKPEDVRVIQTKMFDDMSYWECEGKEAEKQLCYIAGMCDMAEAVIKAIEKAEGSNG